MSFSTQIKAKTWHTVHNTWDLLSCEPSMPGEGLDTILLHLAISDDISTRSDEVSLGFAIGDGLSAWGITGDLFIASIGPVKHWGGSIWLCDVLAKGLIAARPAKIRGGSAPSMATREGISVPGYGMADRVEAMDHAVTFEEEYLLVGSAPPVSTQGTEVTSPHGPDAAFPSVPSSVWASLDSPTVHYPSGWVHESCEYEGIAGVDIYLVRNRYKYQYEETP